MNQSSATSTTNTTRRSTTTTAKTSQRKPNNAKSESIECIARRFLHDFTADVAKSDVHDADHAAWWACSLRKNAAPSNNKNTRSASSTHNSTTALVATPLQLANNSSSRKNNETAAASDASTSISEKRRSEQLAAFAREGCGSKFSPAISSKCSGQKRWDPSTNIVSTEDPLYALLHRRLQEEGFADDFEAAQENFRKRATKSEARSRKEENARKDRELQWYLEVYRPKQKREALCEVESDTRLEISEEEMTSFMRLKQKFWEITRAIQLKEHRRQRQEEAAREAEMRRREVEERHVREYLARMNKQLFDQESALRKQIIRDYEGFILNLFDHATAEREKMARIKLAQLTRLRTEVSHLLSSEHDRRKSILALEATARKHTAQLVITERSEFFNQQRLEIQQHCVRSRKETGRLEIEERGRLLQYFVVGQTIIHGLDNMQNDEAVARLRIENERVKELSTFDRASELSKKNARDAYFYQKSVEIEQEFLDGYDDIWNEADSIFTQQIVPAFLQQQREIIVYLSNELIAQEEESREEIYEEYHKFVVDGARLEATSINLMSEEMAERYSILDTEHQHIRDIIRKSLLASCVSREQAERAALARDEHQAASRLVVEAAILRDSLANERRDLFARQRAHLEKEEHDARHDFVSDNLETLSRLVDDALTRLNELNRAQEAKLLQQALRLTSSFVGIGLAERGECLQVETLVEGGPGMQAGLRLGDMVIAIGGIPVSSTLEMRSALKRTGFVSKYLEVIIRRFIPENGFENMETVRLDAAPLLPTQRPEGKFLDDIEKVSLLVSTTDPKFARFPFYFDNTKKTMRICLPLVEEGETK